MPRGPFTTKSWIGSKDSYEKSDWIMVGLPYDGTCLFKPGTRFGPEMARFASWSIENYSPYQDSDIEDTLFYDAGELEFPFGNKEKSWK